MSQSYVFRRMSYWNDKSWVYVVDVEEMKT
jgi:hypothetical protein